MTITVDNFSSALNRLKFSKSLINFFEDALLHNDELTFEARLLDIQIDLQEIKSSTGLSVDVLKEVSHFERFIKRVWD